jgi:outer membrane biosynthesis protein TonB
MLNNHILSRWRGIDPAGKKRRQTMIRTLSVILLSAAFLVFMSGSSLAQAAKPEHPKAEEKKPEHPKAEEKKPEHPKAKAEEKKPEHPKAEEKKPEHPKAKEHPK